MRDQEPKRGRPRQDVRANAMYAQYLKGFSAFQIGVAYGVSKQTVLGMFSRRGFVIRQMRRQGKP